MDNIPTNENLPVVIEAKAQVTNFPEHPLKSNQAQEGINKVAEFIKTYGPYITLAFFMFRFYTQYRLNRTLSNIERKLK